MSMSRAMPASALCRSLRLVGLVLLAGAFLVSCGGGRHEASLPEVRASEVPAPELVSSSPQAGQAWRVDEPLGFVTSSPMDCDSLRRGGFELLAQDGSKVAGQLSCNGTEVSFTPDVALAVQQRYTVALSTQATGLGGGVLAAPLSWAFITEAQWRGALRIDQDGSSALQVATPRLVVDGQGGAIAVWDQGVGFVPRLHAARYTAAAGWGASVALDPDGDASGLDMAASSAGQTVAVWSRFGPAGLDIWADRYQPGQGWGGPQMIDVAGAGGAMSPRVAMDGLGRAITVWQQGDGFRTNVWASQLDAQGAWNAPQLLEQFDGDAGAPQIALNGQGAGMAVWIQSDPGTGGAELWGRPYLPDSGWGSVERLSLAGEAVESAVVTMGPDGTAMVAWTQIGGAGRGLWGRRFEAASWGTPTQVSASPGSLPGSLQLTLQGDGGGLLAWTEATTKTFTPPFCLVPTFVGGNGCPSRTVTVADLRVQTYTPGAGWGQPTIVDSSDFGDVSNLRLCQDSAGRPCAVWVQSDGLRTAVWFSRGTADGSWSVPEQLSPASLANAMSPQAVALPNGSLLVVWAEFDGQRVHVWSNRLY